MPYYEIVHNFLGYDLQGPLGPPSRAVGRVGGCDVVVEVLEDGNSVTLNGVVRDGEGGAVLFDSTLTARRALVFLDDPASNKLLWNKANQIPGVFQDQLVGIFRRAEEQAGARQLGQRSLDERFIAFLSAGTTEDF